MGPGYTALPLTERLFIWAKQTTLATVTLRRFWVNLQTARVVTRKPANVRMGKGKGGRSGMHTRIKPGTALLAVSSLRPGMLRKLFHRVRVRCSFTTQLVSAPTGPASPIHVCGTPATWVRLRRVQARYVTGQFLVLRDTIRQLRRPPLLGYFTRIFWWRYITPHAVWAPVRTERRRARMRRRVIRRRRYLMRLRPLGLGFLRQLRFHIRASVTRARELPVAGWRRFRGRVLRRLWSLAVLRRTPLLPWYALLRARRYRRLLPYLTYLSATQGDPAQDVSWGGVDRLSPGSGPSLGLRGIVRAQLFSSLIINLQSRLSVGNLSLRWLWKKETKRVGLRRR